MLECVKIVRMVRYEGFKKQDKKMAKNHSRILP